MKTKGYLKGDVTYGDLVDAAARRRLAQPEQTRRPDGALDFEQRRASPTRARTVRSGPSTDFSLVDSRGEPVAVIGPSGCGKSTMLLLAAGLLAPDVGVACAWAARRVVGPSARRPRSSFRSTGCCRGRPSRTTPRSVCEVRGSRRRQARERGRATRSSESGSPSSRAAYPASSPAACASAWGLPRARARRGPAAHGRAALGARRAHARGPAGGAARAVAAPRHTRRCS